MKLTMELKQDDCHEDPRKEFDHESTMVCFHDRYQLGDDHDLRSSDFPGWEEIADHLRKEEDIHTILPLILLDHSGLSMSTGRSWPFDCQWDAGQVGFIYATKANVKEWGIADDKVEDGLRAEVATYDQYLRGDVWGYVIERDGEHVDSCWGFYGHEYAEKEGQDALAYAQMQEDETVAAEEEGEKARALESFLEAVLHDSPYDPAVIARCKSA